MESKILVVDDDPNLLWILEYMLLRQGYDVLTARHGIDGLKLAVQEVPDLVILDVMIPGLNNFEICHRLRHRKKTAQIPVLTLSAYDKDNGLKACADEYLVKPINRVQFLATVEKLLAQKMLAFQKTRNSDEYQKEKGGNKT